MLNFRQLVESTQMRLIKVLFMVLLMLSIGIVVYKSQKAAEQKQADNTLKQLGMALQNYHSTHSEPPRRKAPDEDEAKGP